MNVLGRDAGIVFVVILLLPVADAKPTVDPVLERQIARTDPSDSIDVIIHFDSGRTTNTMTRENSILSADRGAAIVYDYSHLNAAVARMPAEAVSRLREHNEIRGLYANRPVSVLGGDVPGGVEPLLRISTASIGSKYVNDVLNYTGRGVTVAIVDTGMDIDHPALNNCSSMGSECRIIDGWDFAYGDDEPTDVYGHGTRVAGIIGANSTAVTGVAPEVRFFNAKVMRDDGNGNTSDVLAGIDWAIGQGADIISLSLGEKISPNDGFNVMDVFADYAVQQGIVVVAAAGNVPRATGTINSPAAGHGVITVGAVNDHGTNDTTDDVIWDDAYYGSSRGPSAFGRLDPDLVAPGVSILTVCIGDPDCNADRGTSYACPHVSGAAALLLEANRSLKPADVRGRLMHTATGLVNNPNTVFDQGAGLINVSQAITQRLTATINGSDRWEEVMRPGTASETILTLENEGVAGMSLTLSVSNLTTGKSDRRILSSAISLASSIEIGPGETRNVTATIRLPAGTPPQTYGGVISVQANDSSRLRIPVVVSVPLVGAGSFSANATSSTHWGDHLYFALDNDNATAMQVTLSWSNQSTNLGLIVYDALGFVVGASDGGSTTNETVTIALTSSPRYWIEVNASSLAGSPTHFAVAASYDGNVSVSPASWQPTLAVNESVNTSFVIENTGPGNLSNLTLSVVESQAVGSHESNGIVAEASYTPYWSFGMNATNKTGVTHISANLSWENVSKDLDLALLYSNGTNWLHDGNGRYCSCHWNDLTNDSRESIPPLDITHLLATADDIGIGLRNNDTPESFTLFVSVRRYESSTGASVTPATIASLATGTSVNASISLEGGILSAGSHDLELRIEDTLGQRLSITPISATVTTSTICPENHQCESLFGGWNLLALSLAP